MNYRGLIFCALAIACHPDCPEGPGEGVDTDVGADTDADTDADTGAADPDRDGDGVPDDADAFPDDPSEWEDSDGDGVGDNSDLCSGDDASGDQDGDGICDDSDDDRDGDGVPDDEDAYPDDGSASTDYLLIPDYNTVNIERYRSSDGAFVDTFIPATDDLGTYQLGRAVGLVSKDGLLYVSDGPNGRVLRFDAATGAFQDTFVESGSGGLSYSGDLLFDDSGDLLVVSWNGSSGCTGDGEILRYDASGAFVEVHAELAYRVHRMVQHPDGDLYAPYYCGEGIDQLDSEGNLIARHVPGLSSRFYDLEFDEVTHNAYLTTGQIYEAAAKDWSYVKGFGEGFNAHFTTGPEGLYVVDYEPYSSPTPTLHLFDGAKGVKLWSAALSENPYPDGVYVYAGL